MCVSTDHAAFSGTIVYGGRLHHSGHGRPVHVLGYQNTAANLATGPNAMLLHLPARAATMTRENFISVGDHAGLLTSMVDAVRPRSAAVDDGMAWMGWDDPVEVFDHDIYTVLLAGDPTRVPGALDRVAPHKRPRLDPLLLEFYADRYPGHTIAVCCFDNAAARRAKPLLMWYEPTEPDLLVLPALDCHTGAPPEPGAPVPVDHWVLYGTDLAGPGWGSPLTHPPTMRHSLRRFLPDAVMGEHFTGRSLPNGDFALAHDDLLGGDLDRVHRLPPAA